MNRETLRKKLLDRPVSLRTVIKLQTRLDAVIGLVETSAAAPFRRKDVDALANRMEEGTWRILEDQFATSIGIDPKELT